MPDATQQREIAQIALEVLGPYEFALAGASAIREHGLSTRPTDDLDLFTIQQTMPRFDEAVDLLAATLTKHGYTVETWRRFEGFAQIDVSSPSGATTRIDLGVDYRAEPPVHLAIGQVLARGDAVGNKVAALFSRGVVRDYLDVDSIRQSRAYSDVELLELGKRVDAGFDVEMFAECLSHVTRFDHRDVERYGVSRDDFNKAKLRLLAWAGALDRPNGLPTLANDRHLRDQDSPRTNQPHLDL